MTFRITTEVIIPAIGKFIHEHTQEFSDNSNVFGRVAEYRKYIHEMFPECRYQLISAEEVKKA